MKLDTLHPGALIHARRALRGRVAGEDRVAPLPFSGALDDRRGDEMLHRGLFRCNRRRLKPGMVSESTPEFREALRELATIQYFEARVVEGARDAVKLHASEAPRTAGGLLDWLEALRTAGPGQLDPLWSWIATQATEADLHWFIIQELVSEVGAAALVSDICGSRTPLPMLDRLRQMAMLIGVEVPDATSAVEGATWETLTRSNLVTALAANRRWHGYGVGALVAMMVVMPARLTLIEHALTRLGYEIFPPTPPFDRQAAAHLITQQLVNDPQSAQEIASGALMWMRTGVRCLDGYRRHLMGIDAA